MQVPLFDLFGEVAVAAVHFERFYTFLGSTVYPLNEVVADVARRGGKLIIFQPADLPQ